jgi:hypothetical protein
MQELEIVLCALTTKEKDFEQNPMAHQIWESKIILVKFVLHIIPKLATCSKCKHKQGRSFKSQKCLKI